MLLNMTEAMKAIAPPPKSGNPRPPPRPPRHARIRGDANATAGKVEPQVPLEGAHEPSEPPEMADDEQQGRGPVPDAGGPREEGTERPWWRRMFGG
jgi:hypothetical protein